MTTQWQERVTTAQTRSRTIQRQADGLRQAMIGLADGTKTADEIRAAVNAIEWQV